MAKNEISDYDETDSGNTDISGIVLSDATLIDQLDNIARAQMGALARFTGGDTIASASTTDLASVPGQYVTITGVVAIGAFGTIKAGTIKYLKFDGALVLTHNATTLILPGEANITTAAGDMAIFVSEGSGNWRCVAYTVAAEAPYASGTFTPVVQFGGGSTGITYSANGQQGRYVKVGKKVTVWIYIIMSSKGSSTGTATISGLPFTAKTVTGMFWSTGVGYRNFPWTTAGVISGEDVVRMYNGNTSLADGDFTAIPAEFAITLEYEAA